MFFSLQPKDDISSDEDISVSNGDDEVDRIPHTAHRSPGLYPDLASSFVGNSDPPQDWSPSSKSSFSSPDDSFSSGHTKCYSRTGPEVSPRKDLPVTPKKGSPGKKLCPELADKDSIKKKKGVSPALLIFFFGIVLVCILIVFHSLEETEKLQEIKSRVKHISEVYEDFKTELRILNHRFSQPKNFWIQLIGQIESVMVEAPRQPAVILVVVPVDARQTAVCLIHKIAQALQGAFEGKVSDVVVF